MSRLERTPPSEDGVRDEPPGSGPNLTLLYSLIVLAMLAALAIAAFIVLPFYSHRH